MKKKLLLLAILVAISYASISQNTYYFRGGVGTATGGETDWITATNWTTNTDGSADATGGRTTPASNDILIIDGTILNTLNSSRTVYLRMSKDICGSLTIKGSAVVYFSSFSGGTSDVVASSGVTIAATANGVLNAVTGGTNFTTALKVGDYVSTSGTSASLGQVLSIVSNSSMTVTNDYGLTTASATALYRIPTLSISSSFTLEAGSTIHMGTNVSTTGVTQLLFCLKLESGATGSVYGSFFWNRNSSQARLVAVAPNSLVFQSGSTCTIQVNPVANSMSNNTAGPFFGSALGTGTVGSTFAFNTTAPPITFASGSTYTSGSNQRQYTPFGRGVAVTGGPLITAAVSFRPGSNYVQSNTAYVTSFPYFFSNALAIYGNLNLSAIPTNLAAGYIDTLTISGGTALGTGTIHLYGSLLNTTASTVTSTGTVFFSGSVNQTIGGSGSGSFTFATLYNRNTTGVTLAKNITVSTLLGLLGKIDVGTYTITGSGTPTFVSNNATNRTYNQPSGSNQVSGGCKTTANSTAFFLRGINTGTVLIGATITSSSHPTIFPAGTYVASYSSGGNFTASSPATITADSASTPALSLTFTSTEGTVITANATGLNGSLPSFSTYTLNNSTNYTFNGTTAQTTGALLPVNIKNLTVSNPAGVTLSGTDTVKGTLSITSGTFTTGANNFSLGASASATLAAGTVLNINGGVTDFNGRSVTLQSNATGTASITTISGTLSGADNVTVERFIPSGGRRGYVMVSSPVTSTINAGWQEGQPGSPTVGYGTLITGGVAQGVNGYDGPNTSTSSILTYNDNASAGSKWVAYGSPTTTAGSLAPGTGYLLFVRGDRVTGTTSSTNANNSNTTLRATGTVGQGDISPVVVNGVNTVNGNTVGKYTLIANPYPCAIDWNAGITKTNLATSFTVYDPSLRAFVSSNGSVKTPNVGNQQAAYIQSGQAFFVQNDATGNAPAITFTEAAKTTAATTGSNTTVFGEDAAKTQLNINVYRAEDNSFADGAVALFGSQYQAAVDTKEDIYKFNNLSETFALRRSDAVLGLEARPKATVKDTLYFSLGNFAKKAYSMVIDGSNLSGVSAKLEDKFTGKRIAIDEAGTTTYSFNVTEDAASSSNDRFIITFGSTSSSAVVTEGTASTGLYVKMSPNPVRNQLQVSFKTATSATTVIKLVNSLGQVVKTVNAGDLSVGTVNVPVANLASGVYSVQLVSGGKVISTQQVVKGDN